MRVQLLGAVAVGDGTGTVADQDLGGRRARVTLAALALAGAHVPSDRLAAMIWGDELPATWQVALRGIVRGLRSACAIVGGQDQNLIVTMPSGYRLADGVELDILDAEVGVDRAAELLQEGRHRAVLELAEPLTRISGGQLLPDEDADWLAPHRRAVDATALRAVQLVVESCAALGRHHRAVEIARRAVAAHPLDESTHRALIAALDRSGDRAGAVQAYEDCRAVLGESLGIDPSAETVQVYLRTLRDQPASSPGRLPEQTSSFIGRDEELDVVRTALARPGLVTVTGRGGVGKSRLVVHAVAGADEFAGRRFWVSLATVAQDTLVASSVALALAVGTEEPTAAIAHHLAPLGRAVLILDGCEAVADGVASLVAALVQQAPALSVVVTSRARLGVDGEQVIDLDPLSAITDVASLAGSHQARLLQDRVREGGGGELSLDDAVAPHLLDLCRRCAGLPLALELVAAQLAAMPAGDLVDQFDELGPVPGDALRAVARSSYLVLDDDEATVFRRFAVLDGPVGLALVREVVAGDTIVPVRVVRILRELSARGLLTVDRTGPHWRYQQDDDLHRFAGELLAERGEDHDSFARLARAIRARLPEDARATPGPFRDEITAVLGSIRSLFGAALRGRADADRCQELAFRLHRYFATTNLDEGRFWSARLLEGCAPGEWTPYLTYALGYLSYWSGDTEEAMRQLQVAVEHLDGATDSYRARALIFLAGLLDDLDRGPESIEYVRLSIDAAAAHDTDLQCSAAMGMGSVLAERADPAAARYAADAIELCRRSGSVEQLSIAMPTAAMICWQVGALDQARSYLSEAMPLNTGTVRIARVVLLSAAAGVALADGEPAAAIDYGQMADREAGELGVEREVPLIRAILARALLAEHDLVAAAQHATGALEVGVAMTVDFPLAVGLETAALVLHAGGWATDADLRELLGTAAAVRRRGERPASPSLAGAVEQLSRLIGGLDGGGIVDARAAARHAIALLTASTGHGTHRTPER